MAAGVFPLWTNACRALGDNPLMWFVPWSPVSGDGIEWGVVAGCSGSGSDDGESKHHPHHQTHHHLSKSSSSAAASSSSFKTSSKSSNGPANNANRRSSSKPQDHAQAPTGTTTSYGSVIHESSRSSGLGFVVVPSSDPYGNVLNGNDNLHDDIVSRVPPPWDDPSDHPPEWTIHHSKSKDGMQTIY